jgi:acyl-coenzyme A thioesterase PaaI-like protein
MIDTLQQTGTITPALRALGYDRVDSEGWYCRASDRIDRFDDNFAGIRLRREAGGQVRLRLAPEDRAKNMNGVIHGGFLMALVDHALFMVPVGLGSDGVVGGSTIDTSMQFYAPTNADIPIDLVGTVMRETGRMVFTRGVVEQDGTPVAGFAGTVRKPSPALAAARLEEFLASRLTRACE